MSRVLTIGCVPTCEGLTIIDEINAALAAAPNAQIGPHHVFVFPGSAMPEGAHTIPFHRVVTAYVEPSLLVDLLLEQMRGNIGQVENIKHIFQRGELSKDDAQDALAGLYDGYLHPDAAMRRNMRYYLPMLVVEHPDQAARLQAGMQELQDYVNDFRNHDLLGIPRKKDGRKKAEKSERAGGVPA